MDAEILFAGRLSGEIEDNIDDADDADSVFNTADVVVAGEAVIAMAAGDATGTDAGDTVGGGDTVGTTGPTDVVDISNAAGTTGDAVCTSDAGTVVNQYGAPVASPDVPLVQQVCSQL